MINFACDCGKKYKVSDEKAGKKIKCKECSNVLTIPEVDVEMVEDTSSPKPKAAPSPVKASDENRYQTQTSWSEAEKSQISRLKDAYDRMIEQVSTSVVGQEMVVKEVIISLFGRGHCLLLGVPGLAKTLLVSTLGKCLGLDFKRVQFTPDLMPSDITGTEVIQENKTTGEREFRFIKGPIFTNLLLADEINRTPPKTQASLLEAMQEHQVTVGGKRYELDKPFFVLATQNPIEQEGTYSLPEAQLDRFMFRIFVDYPTAEDEIKILDMTTSTYKAEIKSVLDGAEILELQALVRKVLISKEIKEYIVRLVRMTRTGREGSDEYADKWLSWGAGPRACQNLVIGAKANAILDGRYEVQVDDVKAVAKAVLGHRITTNFAAAAEGIDTHKVVEELLIRAG